jgi:TonB family protein
MLKPFFAAVALLSTNPALARDWASAGGWDVAEVDSETCVMGLEYEGEGSTMLLLGLRTDGGFFLAASNHGWSAKKDQVYELVYEFDDVQYDGGKSLGTESGGRRGFVTTFHPSFLKNFAAATYINIKSSDGVTIDELKLTGSAAGLAQVRRCVAHLGAIAAADARERARFAHIPKDPFAKVTGEPVPQEPTRPVPRLPSFLTIADYPDSAIRAREQGTTTVRLSIDPTGRVSDCMVTSSSGSAALDSTTCRLARMRMRYTPSKDAAGVAQRSDVEDSFTWKLPE